MKNKFVITGPPSSGKTTILNILQQRGAKVLSDTSREILIKKDEYGVDDISSVAFSDLIFKRQLDKESSLDENEICFLDMSLVECIVYRKLKRQSLDILLELEMGQRYDEVFLFEPLPFEYDGFRDKNDEMQINEIYSLMKKTYFELGYTVQIIPRLSVEQRLQMIILHLKNKGVEI